MPYLTYSIKPEIVDNFENSKTKNIDKFLNYIDLLNNKNRAILINKNNNVLEKLSKKYFETINKISTIDQHVLNETLQNLVRILSDSMQYNVQSKEIKTKIDFEKNLEAREQTLSIFSLTN